MRPAIACLCLAVAAISASAASLCTPTEQAIVSFQTKSKKLMFICKGAKAAYVVYRFGLPGKIELQYPDRLDQTSWKKFAYQSFSRAGGKENGGFYQRTLDFKRDGVSYGIYESWMPDTDKYESGIRIFDGKKEVTIKAAGSLLPEQEDADRFADDPDTQ